MAASESTPLLRPAGGDLSTHWFSTQPVQITQGYDYQQIVDYNPGPLLSVRSVLIKVPGAVISKTILWIEQFVVVMVMAASATLSHFWENRAAAKATWMAKAETEMLNCVAILATVSAFLIGFFLSLNVARWWRLRTDGIGGMWSASSQLTMFLSQFVTQDKHVLTSINRYARASLMMIFMRRRGYLDDLDKLVDREILTTEEVNSLKAYRNNLSESIWTWNANIVHTLYLGGKFKSEYQVVYAYQLVNIGRSAAALIGAQMGTPIPPHYVHMVGLIVTTHNMLLAIVCGHIMAESLQLDERTRAVFILLKAFTQTCIYNMLLIVNESFMDPFQGDLVDFPMRKFVDCVGTDADSYVQAGEHLPPWLKAWDGKGDAAPKKTKIKQDV